MPYIVLMIIWFVIIIYLLLCVDPRLQFGPNPIPILICFIKIAIVTLILFAIGTGIFIGGLAQ